MWKSCAAGMLPLNLILVLTLQAVAQPAGQPAPTDGPASRPRLGLHVSVAREGEGPAIRTVARVDAESPSERAGLKSGDRILRVAGRPVAEMTEDDMRAALGTPTLIFIDIQRAEASRRIRIDLLSRLERNKENQREIDATLAEMSAALMRGDGKAVAAAYSDDGIVLGETGEQARGREALEKYWAGPAAKSWTLKCQPIEGDLDLVTQRGRSTLVHSIDGQDKASIVDFLLIWKRDDSGKLRIAMDAYWPAPKPTEPAKGG